MKLGRNLIVIAGCLLWLAGCQTASMTSDPLEAQASATLSGDEPGGLAAAQGTPPATPELLGVDPSDDLSIGKQYFHQGSYGLAERSFRRAVELHPKDAESWLGLAAAYDKLRRFDLADRAYAQAIRIAGATPEILNNQGFSYMLRGDRSRARTTLLAASAQDPESAFIKNNLDLLDETGRKKKEIN